MRRRRFIELAGAASAGAILTGTGRRRRRRPPPARRTAKPLLAKDVAAYLRSLAEVEEPSVDRIVIGDPGTEVTGIGTCWLPYWDTCRQAVRDGVNLLIVHEPTFYTHWDLDEKSPDLFAASAAGKEAYGKAVLVKKDWILANKLVIIRCHDVLDKIGGFGIPFAFGRLLGFSGDDIIRSEPYLQRLSHGAAAGHRSGPGDRPEDGGRPAAGRRFLRGQGPRRRICRRRDGLLLRSHRVHGPRAGPLRRHR